MFCNFYVFIVIQFQVLKISSMMSSLIMNDLEACFKISKMNILSIF